MRSLCSNTSVMALALGATLLAAPAWAQTGSTTPGTTTQPGVTMPGNSTTPGMNAPPATGTTGGTGMGTATTPPAGSGMGTAAPSTGGTGMGMGGATAPGTTTTAPATRSEGPPTTTTPEAGANSFTEGQARSRIEAAGYTNVQGLAKDDQGVWRGKAMRNGTQSDVGLDFRGNVVTGNAPAAAR